MTKLKALKNYGSTKFAQSRLKEVANNISDAALAAQQQVEEMMKTKPLAPLKDKLPDLNKTV